MIETTQSIWSQLPAFLGVSAIFSGGVSALVNYLMTMRQLKHKSTQELLERKLQLYSTIICYLDSMNFKYDALEAISKTSEQKQERFAFTREEWQQLVTDIDDKIRNNYYLLNRKLQEKWVWAKTLYNPKSREIMPELRKLLVNEYNILVEKYNIDQDIIPPIQYTSLDTG